MENVTMYDLISMDIQEQDANWVAIDLVADIIYRKHVPFNIGCFLFVTLVTLSSVSGS